MDQRSASVIHSESPSWCSALGYMGLGLGFKFGEQDYTGFVRSEAAVANEN